MRSVGGSSAFGGDVEANVAYARDAMLDSLARGKFLFELDGEETSLEFRIDVDYHMCEGRSLSIRFARNAEFYGTDRGRELAAAHKDQAPDLVRFYQAASEAAAAAEAAIAA